MRPKCSGYISIYNDWDLLGPAVRSFAPVIDELVIVDGAYEWMLPYLEVIGRTPLRSDARMYEVLDASGIPYRVVSRVWKSEVEKRIAGYEACSHRYVFRLDADEIMFFDEPALEEFFRAEAAVGEMQMPIYMAPGWIRGKTGADRIECQCFLFDRDKIPSDIHLNYLWLILGSDKLPRAGTKPFPVFPKPLAFNAHLTGWRGPATAVNRAAFYSLNFMRTSGVPFVPELRDKPLEDFGQLFARISPDVYAQHLLLSRLVAGEAEIGKDWFLRPTPLTPAQEDIFRPCFDQMLSQLAEMNRDLANGRSTIAGQRVTIDLSTQDAVDALTPDGLIVFEFDEKLATAKAELRALITEPPWNSNRLLESWVMENLLAIRLPRPASGEPAFLRRSLEFSAWMRPEIVTQQFRVMRDRPLPFTPPPG
jgi:hypothetical protein